MQEPTLEQINEKRKQGYRPGVVVFFYNNDKKVLLFYKKEYSLWMPPQGGIKNNSTPDQAIEREMNDEVGETFFRQADRSFMFFMEESLEFSQNKHGIRDLKTDDGQEVNMIGKHYYFYATKAYKDEVELSESEFDEYFWLNHNDAKFLIDNERKSSKKDILLKALDQLKKLQIIE